jgi:hypothetical protein
MSSLKTARLELLRIIVKNASVSGSDAAGRDANRPRRLLAGDGGRMLSGLGPRPLEALGTGPVHVTPAHGSDVRGMRVRP